MDTARNQHSKESSNQDLAPHAEPAPRESHRDDDTDGVVTAQLAPQIIISPG